MELFLGKPSISLTGFMFTGKSSVGRILSHKLGLEFIDLDHQITGRAGISVEKIFASGGEPRFRELERETVADVLPVPGRVVATGGGVVIDPRNRNIMARNSCIIWLEASPEIILERLRNSSGPTRPLLCVPDPEKEIIRLLQDRDPCYRHCNFSVKTDSLTVTEVSDVVLSKLAVSAKESF